LGLTYIIFIIAQTRYGSKQKIGEIFTLSLSLSLLAP